MRFGFEQPSPEPCRADEAVMMEFEPIGKSELQLCIEERIRGRAYGLYIQRGMSDGHGEEDWLRAEDELRSADCKTMQRPRFVGDDR